MYLTMKDRFNLRMNTWKKGFQETGVRYCSNIWQNKLVLKSKSVADNGSHFILTK